MLEQAIQEHLKMELDEEQYQANAQELSGGKRAGKRCLADRVDLQGLVEWVKKTAAVSTTSYLLLGSHPVCFTKSFVKNWSLYLMGKLAVQVYPGRGPIQRKGKGKGNSKGGTTKGKNSRQKR